MGILNNCDRNPIKSGLVWTKAYQSCAKIVIYIQYVAELVTKLASQMKLANCDGNVTERP